MWEFCDAIISYNFMNVFWGRSGLTMRWASFRNSSATSVDGVRIAGAGMERPCLVVRMVFSVEVRSVMLVD